MIWEGDIVFDPGRRALREHVADMLHGTAIATGESTHGLSDVADSVALFCLGEGDTSVFSDPLLSLIAARALYGAGRDRLAEDVVRGHAGAAAPLHRYLPMICCRDMPPHLWPSCAAGVVRPDITASAHDGTVWVLDLSRLHSSGCELLELGVLQVLGRLLGGLAGLWDRTGGRGAVALVFRQESGTPESPANEWLAYARAQLSREKNRRGWHREPEVFGLDLPRRRRKRQRGR